VDSSNAKALYRRAQAWMATADFVEAELDIRAGLAQVSYCFYMGAPDNLLFISTMHFLVGQNHCLMATADFMLLLPCPLARAPFLATFAGALLQLLQEPTSTNSKLLLLAAPSNMGVYLFKNLSSHCRSPTPPTSSCCSSAGRRSRRRRPRRRRGCTGAQLFASCSTCAGAFAMSVPAVSEQLFACCLDCCASWVQCPLLPAAAVAFCRCRCCA